jgi:hypothetical protein
MNRTINNIQYPGRAGISLSLYQEKKNGAGMMKNILMLDVEYYMRNPTI